jgi:hypothetical protein
MNKCFPITLSFYAHRRKSSNCGQLTKSSNSGQLTKSNNSDQLTKSSNSGKLTKSNNNGQLTKSSNSGQVTNQVARHIFLCVRHDSMWSGGVTDSLILNLSSTLGEWADSSSGCAS